MSKWIANSYDVYIWDHELERWESHAEGVMKWGLRRVFRELRNDGWSSLSVLVESHYEVEV